MSDMETAEERFRQAFERLKADRPKVLDPGTVVSQNNVAREAGCDSSALKKTRFPALVAEIQEYVELHQRNRTSMRQLQMQQRSARSDMLGRLDEVERQRDSAQSKLASANRRIVDLTAEVDSLRQRLEELAPSPKPLSPHRGQ